VISQGTPLYGVLRQEDGTIGPRVMLVVGWKAYGDVLYPVAVELGDGGPAGVYREPREIVFCTTYAAAADVIDAVTS
jgi:hypothetical protein